jgi:hypothetical protein
VTTDPEDTVELMPVDLEETEVDVADEFERPVPLEAEPADVLEQRQALDVEDDYRDA